MRGEGYGRDSRSLLVVKVGGSVATDKDKAFTPRIRAVNRIASIFKELKKRGYKLVVVLGGGSYGHYAVELMRSNRASVAELVSVTSLAMHELSMLVADIFMAEGLNPIIYPPHAASD